jgi:DNA-binding transcriptional MocR family regulator
MSRLRRAATIAFRPTAQSKAPVYGQLATSIEAAISDGRIQLGTRLPSERKLAADLELSRTTVTLAYRELEARGLVRGRVGHGTVVIAADSETAAIPWLQRASRFVALAGTSLPTTPDTGADVISFADGWAHPSLYPRAQLEEICRGVSADLGASLVPSPVEGLPALRSSVAAWLRTKGITAPADNVMITGGAQHGLNLIARTLLSPGDVVLMESPTWLGAIRAFQWAGAEVVGVRMDADGICCDALEDALARLRPKLIYLIPNFHCPTGRVLSLEKRHEVLRLAARARVPILESDVYGDVYFDDPPPPSLKALDDAGLVIHQGSMSKISSASLRIGWLVGPSAALDLLARAKAIQELTSPTLPQSVVAAFMSGAHLERHLARLRASCRQRRDALVSALREHCRGLQFQVPTGGFYLWARLPAPLTAEHAQAAALENGVAIRAGDPFIPDGTASTHVRLCFAACGREQIGPGARQLGSALNSALRRGRTATMRHDRYPAV